MRLYLFFLGYLFITIVNGGISNFSSQITQSFHYDNPKAALLNMALGASQSVSLWLAAGLFQLTRMQSLSVVFGLLVSIAGAIMMIAIPEQHGASRMVGLCLAYFYTVPGPIYYSWQSGTVAGATKRIVFALVLQVGYSVGNIIGPQAYQHASAQFTTAKVVMLVMFGATMGTTVLIVLVHWIWNRRKAKGDGYENPTERVREQLSNHTDWERQTYHYIF